MKQTIISKKDCRVDYANGYSLLINFMASPNVIIYYERSHVQLGDLHGTYAYKKRNEMPLDLYPFTFFPYSIAQ